jgi:hypothetical protein
MQESPSSTMAALICWIVVPLMRLHALKMSTWSAPSCRALEIWGAVAPAGAWSTGRTGRTKGIPGETPGSQERAQQIELRWPWRPPLRVDHADFMLAVHSFSCLARLAGNFCQHRMLEAVFAVVDACGSQTLSVVKHLGGSTDNSASSVTRVN